MENELETLLKFFNHSSVFIVNKMVMIDSLERSDTLLYTLFTKIDDDFIKNHIVLRMNDALLQLTLLKYPEFFDTYV